MAFDPKNMPQVGDEYGNGIVARAVATAEGIEVTVREFLPADDDLNVASEERPVSIPQRVHPSAYDYVTRDEEEVKAEEQEAEDVEKERVQAAKAAQADTEKQDKEAAKDTGAGSKATQPVTPPSQSPKAAKGETK